MNAALPRGRARHPWYPPSPSLRAPASHKKQAPIEGVDSAEGRQNARVVGLEAFSAVSPPCSSQHIKMSRERDRDRDRDDRGGGRDDRERQRDRSDRNAGRVSVLVRNLPLDTRWGAGAATAVMIGILRCCWRRGSGCSEDRTDSR